MLLVNVVRLFELLVLFFGSIDVWLVVCSVRLVGLHEQVLSNLNLLGADSALQAECVALRIFTMASSSDFNEWREEAQHAEDVMLGATTPMESFWQHSCRNKGTCPRVERTRGFHMFHVSTGENAKEAKEKR